MPFITFNDDKYPYYSATCKHAEESECIQCGNPIYEGEEFVYNDDGAFCGKGCFKDYIIETEG